MFSNFCRNSGSISRERPLKLTMARNMHAWHLLCVSFMKQSFRNLSPSNKQINKLYMWQHLGLECRTVFLVVFHLLQDKCYFNLSWRFRLKKGILIITDIWAGDWFIVLCFASTALKVIVELKGILSIGSYPLKLPSAAYFQIRHTFFFFKFPAHSSYSRHMTINLKVYSDNLQPSVYLAHWCNYNCEIGKLYIHMFLC